MVPAGDIFQQIIDEIFKDISNVFGIAAVLIVGYDTNGIDHDKTLKWVMQIFLQENLKANKNNCYFRCTRIIFFEEIISKMEYIQTQENCVLTGMPP